MDITQIDNYMPKGPAFKEKLKIIEKKLIKEALQEKKALKGKTQSSLVIE